MATRTSVLNALASAYGYTRYLEIGTRQTKDNFAAVQCEYKTGVDPKGEAGIDRVTSDVFFANRRPKRGRIANALKYDLIFIDGDHSYEQSRKDVENALDFLADGGAIVMHDCRPVSPESVSPVKPDSGRPWNGEVYRTFLELRGRDDLVTCCVDCDWGCGVVMRGRTDNPPVIPPSFVFGEYLRSAESWLGVVGYDTWKASLPVRA